jgi:type IV pilus assembly protein PilA
VAKFRILCYFKVKITSLTYGMRIRHLKKVTSSEGFTLLELIVVVAVLGILVAIAIQQFQLYRARAIDASMRSDLKNAALAMESYYGEFLSYPATESAILMVGYRKTFGVNLSITVPTPSTFTLTATRPNGSQPSFSFDSSTGLIN